MSIRFQKISRATWHKKRRAQNHRIEVDDDEAAAMAKSQSTHKTYCSEENIIWQLPVNNSF